MATTYDKASLVMIPSGVKESKLYSIKPTSGDGDFTFSRGTDTATRVNASGLIEKERSNQILQSNSFDTTWVNVGSTETGGQSGYDGSSDAWLLEKTSANGRLEQFTFGSSVYTFSVYAKAGTKDWLYLYLDDTGGSTNPRAFFDLSSGAIGTQTQTIDASITDVGGGWYRCSVTGYTSTSLGALIWVADADNDTSGTSGNIYLQDAMLNQGLVAQPYIETTTAAVYEGITDNLPRLDYSGGASCPSLLLEPSRTNSIPNSEYIASWAGANTTIVTNAAISPEGVQNASSVTFASGGYWYKSVSLSYSAGQAFTWSIYATTQDQVTRWGASTPSGTDTFSVVDAGNGWYRQSITRVVSGSGTANFQPLMDSVFVGVGTTFNVYAAQLEASASYVSSYIPTYGTSASRAEDAIDTTTLSAISSGEVSYFLDIDGAPDPSTNSTSSNLRWYFYSGSFVTWNNNTSSYHRIRCTTSLGNEYFTLPASRTERCKVCVLLTATNIKVISNGVVVGSRTIDGDWSSTNKIDSTITNAVGVVPVKEILLFPTRLTDAEAIALTTI